MLGLGWTEMLVIGVAALIFIGPKDLPIVMKRLGQITGQIRRMGSEFQREINKTTGLDEVRNLRNAITAPLKQTTDQIRRDFNAMSATGEVKPSGIIKPADPKAESIVNEIHAAAGMTPPPATPPAVPVKAALTPKKVAVKKAPARAKAAPTAPVVTAELAPVSAVVSAPPAPPVKKPAASKAAPAKIDAAAVPVVAPKPRAAAKPKAAPAAPLVAAATVPVTPAPKKRTAAKKPAAPAAKAGTE